MTEKNDESNLPDQRIFPELESMLRTKIGDGVSLVEYTAKDLLPPGENYGSLILKIDALIKRNADDDKTEEINLIAKTPPVTQKQRDMFDSPFTFNKEIFMYETILPTYQRFEKDCGVSDEDIFDVGPTFYGSRLSLEKNGEFDDNAVILMENLKTRGYYTCNRQIGLDLPHAKLAIKAMARFHAIGIAMKIKDPEFFGILKVRSKCLDLKNPEEWIHVMEIIYKNIKEDPIIGQHYDKCILALNAGGGQDCWTAPPKEPWSTIIHADFWINNILFHRNEETKVPDDVKFVDYQNYLFLSPTRELSFFLGSGLDHNVILQHFDELIDLYYDTFMSRLNIMGCDTEPYARDKFNEQLPADALIEFAHITFMLKIITKNVDVNDPDWANVANAMRDDGSELFYVRLRDVVNVYLKRGWM